MTGTGEGPDCQQRGDPSLGQRPHGGVCSHGGVRGCGCGTHPGALPGEPLRRLRARAGCRDAGHGDLGYQTERLRGGLGAQGGKGWEAMDLAGGRPMGSGGRARRPQRQVAERALGFLCAHSPLAWGLGPLTFSQPPGRGDFRAGTRSPGCRGRLIRLPSPGGDGHSGPQPLLVDGGTGL